RVHGVTYGPFAPGDDGLPFPAPGAVQDDFARMRAGGVNALRTYHVPPEWLLDLAGREGLTVFVDVPWPKHLCFLHGRRAPAPAPSPATRSAPPQRPPAAPRPCSPTASATRSAPPSSAGTAAAASSASWPSWPTWPGRPTPGA